MKYVLLALFGLALGSFGTGVVVAESVSWRIELHAEGGPVLGAEIKTIQLVGRDGVVSAERFRNGIPSTKAVALPKSEADRLWETISAANAWLLEDRIVPGVEDSPLYTMILQSGSRIRTVRFNGIGIKGADDPYLSLVLAIQRASLTEVSE